MLKYSTKAAVAGLILELPSMGVRAVIPEEARLKTPPLPLVARTLEGWSITIFGHTP